MNRIHYLGAKTVQWIQGLPVPSSPFLFASVLGDPPAVCLVAFPLAFFLHPVLGVATLLSTAFAEWLNGILKWILFGDRPYWWVLGYTRERIKLTQFPITCETGPGSPSGHCMVAVAGWLPLILYLNQYKSRYRLLANVSFGAFLFMVSISRLYVAAHFPHQVIGGLVGGFLIGLPFYIWANRYFRNCRCVYGVESYNEMRPSILLRPFYLANISVISFALAYGFGELLSHLGFDINWSHRLAKKACLRKEWVSATTSLVAGYARISGSIFGLAFAFAFRPAMPHCSARSSVTFKRVFLSSTMGILLLLTVDALFISAADILHLILPTLLGLRRNIGSSGEPDIYFLIYFAVKSSMIPITVGLFLPIMFSRACVRIDNDESPCFQSMSSQSPSADISLDYPPVSGTSVDLSSPVRMIQTVPDSSLKRSRIRSKNM